MTSETEPKPVSYLDDALHIRRRGQDKDSAIEEYYQLLLAGHPLNEVMSKVGLDHPGQNDLAQQSPVDAAPGNQPAPAGGGMVLPAPTRVFNADVFEAIISEVRTTGLTGEWTCQDRPRLLRLRYFVTGAFLVIGALVASTTLLGHSELWKVAADIKNAPGAVAFPAGSASGTPANTGSTLVGPGKEANTGLPAYRSETRSEVIVAGGKAQPDAAVVAASPPIVAVVAATPKLEEKTGQPSSVPSAKAADGRGEATAAAAAETATNAIVGEASAPHPPAAATSKNDDGSERPSTHPAPRVAGISSPETAAIGTPADASVGAPASTAFGGAAQADRAEPRPPDTVVKTLLSRGDALFGIGDVSSARLFYRRGADLGNATAALRLGESFDAAFLQRAGLGRLAGDAKKALYWYRRAHELGNGDAEVLADSLIQSGGNEK